MKNKTILFLKMQLNWNRICNLKKDIDIKWGFFCNWKFYFILIDGYNLFNILGNDIYFIFMQSY